MLCFFQWIEICFPLYIWCLLLFFPFLLLNICLCVGLNPALLSDQTHLAHINQASFSWLSLSLSDRTDQCISFCALLWSALQAALFYLPGLCHAHLHSALLGCSALWESCVALALGQQVGKALLGFSNWPPTPILKALLWKLPRPHRVGQLYHFCSHFYTSYWWWIIEGLISLLKESRTAEEAESCLDSDYEKRLS